MNPIAIILIIAAIFMITFILMRKSGTHFSTRDNTDSLRKHFGDDYGKILGGAKDPEALSPASTPMLTAPVNLSSGPVSTVIKQKMSGAAFLGININVVEPHNMPKAANVDFCNLVSLMTAKGLGACAKSNAKSFSIEVKSEGENTFVRCICPAVSIPASEENIKKAVEKLSGTFTSETENSVETTMALIPTNNIS